MKYIFLTLLVCCHYCSWSQATDSIKFKRTSIGVVFSPDYSYRTLHYVQSNKWIKDLRNNEEMPAFGYTTGVALKFELTKKTSFETGLFYSVKGEQTKYVDLTWQSPGNNYAAKTKTKFQFKYLELPLSVSRVIGNRKLSFLATAGVSINLFTQRKTNVISILGGDKIISSSDVDLGYSKLNIAGTLGFGIKYALSKRLSLYIVPVYRQFLNSIVADKKAKECIYSVGTNIGVYYKIKPRSRTGMQRRL
jgi:opacity protein-like surface antigen